MILFLSVSLVGAANIESDGNDTSLFSYDNDHSQDYLTQSNVVDGSIDELQMDSNLKSEDYISNDTIDDNELTISDSNDQLAQMGSSNSLLRASMNTFSADENSNLTISDSNSESLDILSVGEDDDSGLTDSNTKLDTIIQSDNLAGLPGELLTIYVIVTDINGNDVTNGTVVFTTNGKTYYATVKNGLAIIRDVELPFSDSVDEIRFLENDEYKGSSLLINVTVEIAPGSDNPGGISDDVIENDSAVENSTDLAKESIIKNVDKNATANPIFVLLDALIAIVGNGIFRFRK